MNKLKLFAIPVLKNAVRGVDQVVAVVPMVMEFAVHVRHLKITTIVIP